MHKSNLIYFTIIAPWRNLCCPQRSNFYSEISPLPEVHTPGEGGGTGSELHVAVFWCFVAVGMTAERLFNWTVVVLTCQHKDSAYAFQRGKN